MELRELSAEFIGCNGCNDYRHERSPLDRGTPNSNSNDLDILFPAYTLEEIEKKLRTE